MSPLQIIRNSSRKLIQWNHRTASRCLLCNAFVGLMGFIAYVRKGTHGFCDSIEVPELHVDHFPVFSVVFSFIAFLIVAIFVSIGILSNISAFCSVVTLLIMSVLCLSDILLMSCPAIFIASIFSLFVILSNISAFSGVDMWFILSIIC